MEPEFNIWTHFLEDLIEEKFCIYTTGGSVLGLKVLQLFLEKYQRYHSDSVNFFENFLQMKLIKDWDFILYASNNEYENKIKPLMKKYNIYNEGKTIKILRLNNDKNQIKGDVLFEILIREAETYANLELPMTTMKILLTKTNLFQIFEIALIFFLNLTINAKIELFEIKKLMNKIKIEILPHQHGLFVIEKLETGGISNDFLFTVNEFTSDINIQQFLISHFVQPDRMFSRLFSKNKQKSEKIKILFQNNKTEIPNWLLQTEKISHIASDFIWLVKKKIQNIYGKYEGELEKIFSLLAETIKYKNLIDLKEICTYQDIIKKEVYSDPNAPIKQEHKPIFYQEEYIKKFSPEINIIDKISKPYRKKVINKIELLKESYVKLFQTFLNELTCFYQNINISRLAGMYSQFDLESKKIIKDSLVPTMGDHVSKFHKLSGKFHSNKMAILLFLLIK